MASERTERKKERTRQAIRAAAIELAMERDFQLVSLDDIADRADVARGTIYNLYSRKEGLLAEIVAPLMRSMAERVEALIARGPVPLDDLTEILAEAWEGERGTLGLMLRLKGEAIGHAEADHKRLVSAFVAAFGALREASRLRPATARDAARLFFRVAVPALEVLDPAGGGGRSTFVAAMKGLLLAQPGSAK